MRIAVQGCCHGELDRIYKSIIDQQKSDGIPVELLLICGDFQALRNKNDLDCMAVPDKYKQLGDFYKYYNGDKLAPIPTIFIGGNHEASNYLWELFHGGFVCPNIYYLGAAGIVNFGGLRIGGLSGIFKPQHFNTGYFERQPLERGDIRSIYHVRRISTWKLSKLREPVDIILSHDWPLGIARHGNIEDLLSKKKFLRKEVTQN
jgi:lariat debranching enzyme